jgi:hypothetical protein
MNKYLIILGHGFRQYYGFAHIEAMNEKDLKKKFKKDFENTELFILDVMLCPDEGYPDWVKPKKNWFISKK